MSPFFNIFQTIILLGAVFLAVGGIPSVIAVPLEKKSDIAQFTSAINAAGRLRYGKRAAPSNWEENAYAVEEPVYILPDSQFQYPSYGLIKRAFNTDSLVASLNNAERLRFGRK